MKRKFILFLVLGLMLLCVGFIAYAEVSINISSGIFGGRITNTKATEIETKEGAYNCSVPGETIEVNLLKNLKAPTGYMIETGVENKTGYKIQEGQWIIGKYSGTTPIECTLKVTPFTVDTVELATITLYGTSKY